MQRDRLLAQIDAKQADWDILVIGGGASGLGTALDSITRGYSTILLERGDFAEGTSSRSTKLIHGGIRYLRQGNFQLVRKALLERARLLHNAPHLVHACPFIIPAKNKLQLLFYQAGIKLYDKLAGELLLQPSYTLSKEEVRRRLPTVCPQHLAGGVVYFDGQFNDARLAINLAQTIVEQGGTALNYIQVERLLKRQGKVVGVVAKEMENGRVYEIRAKVVINATGAFCDTIRCLDEPQAKPCITLSQGAHLVLPRAFFPTDHALVIPKTPDGRVLFLIPWHDRVLVGTTDTPVANAERDPRVKVQEITYLLETVGQYLTHPPKESDILSWFAGTRPLVKPERNWKASSWISRDHVVLVSPSQLVSVIGGKWTTYRRMAEDTVDIAARVAQLPPSTCQTKDLRIHGWQVTDPKSDYGADATLIEQMAGSDSALRTRLHPDLPCRGIDVLWSVRKEMARTVKDVLARRTHSIFLEAKASCLIAPEVAKIMARELGYNAIWEAQETAKIIKKIIM